MRSICSLDSGSRPRRSLPSALVTARLPRRLGLLQRRCDRRARPP
jgi:hypothetical protein